MSDGIEKYGKSLVLQACVFRNYGITKKWLPKEKYEKYKHILKLNDIKLKSMNLEEKDNEIYLIDVELYSLMDEINNIRSIIDDEFIKKHGLSYTVYLLIKKANSLGGGLILPNNYVPNIYMQIRNLILINRISLEPNGFILNENDKYKQFIEECITEHKEKERRLFEKLKNTNFS